MKKMFDQVGEEQEAFERVLEVLNRNFGCPAFNSIELAKQAQLSLPTLRKIVRKEINENPTRLIINRRLDEAMNLMNTYHLNISQTARKAGFNDLSYFTVAFKKRFGKKPSEAMMEAVNKPYNNSVSLD
jgi:AraC-like DNA-binding protein